MQTGQLKVFLTLVRVSSETLPQVKAAGHWVVMLIVELHPVVLFAHSAWHSELVSCIERCCRTLGSEGSL